MSTFLADALRRDRLLVALALLVVTALAWWWLLIGAGMGMDAFEMTRHSLMAMPAGDPPAWSASYGLLMFSMWWVMMIAMMLPSATPVVLLAAALNQRSSADEPPYGPTSAFTGGYLLAWGVFSAVAVGLQWGLAQAGAINDMLVSVSRPLSGWLLLLAGAWQFSPWKQACLRHCRSPVEFLTRHRRSGVTGALQMGFHHGLYCLGCCWFLMALLFVGGVMNLYWIVGLTIYVWLEKVMPGGPALSRVAGAGLFAVGGWLLMAPGA